MIAAFVILFIASAAFLVTLRGSVAACFTYVLMPAVLLVFTVAPVEIEKLPDITTIAAVGYGTLAALLLKGGEPLGVRFHPVDGFVVLLSVIAVVSATAAASVWTGVSTLGSETLEVIIPYFMGRCAFAQRRWRLRAAMVLVGLACLIGLIGLIEFRLDPLFYSRRVLKPFGLTSVAYEGVLTRFGRFRAQATFAHPIDLGNGGALMACMIGVLACTAGRKLTTPWVALGLAASVVMTLTSISFTSIVAIGAMAGVAGLCVATRWAGPMLLPLTVATVAFYVGLTAYFVETPLPQTTYGAYGESLGEAGVVDGSLNVRHLIVKQTWPFAERAGLFGFNRAVDARDMGLESVDNAYMLFIVRNGWLYLVAFVALLLAVASVGGRAVFAVPDVRSRVPVAAGVGGIVGLMIGMYTVFFGFVYARLFIILMGLTVTMCQQALDRARPAVEAQPVPPRRGFAPVMAGR